MAQLRQCDCLEFLESLPEESLDLVATDPAYSGMNQHMSFGHGRIVGRYSDPDNAKWFTEWRDEPETFLRFLELCKRALKPDRHIYVMFDSFSLLTLGHLVRRVFDVKNLITWDKVRLGMGHYYRRRHEFILMASKGKRRLSSRAYPDVWRLKRIVKAAYPTQKPVELFEIMITASTHEGEVVCDPFCGSASAGVAALRLGRGFVGADLCGEAIELAETRLNTILGGAVDPLQARSAIPAGERIFWR